RRRIAPFYLRMAGPMRWSLLEPVRSRLADERGSLRKQAATRIALCYPSPYHVGMSSPGFQPIYREIHAHRHAPAGRAFPPCDALTLPRHELRTRLSQHPGFYVPGLSSTWPGVAKADDDRLPARSQIITPQTELRSMFLIEPERGCSRGCTYCVMRRTTNGGMRTVDPERVLELLPEDARRVGLVGAAVTDHPRIVELVRTLVDEGREVGISSLRADRLCARPELISLLA